MDQAAALLQSILKNDALVDGNQRLGWLATSVFLEMNGVSVVAVPNDDVYAFVMDVTAGQACVEEIAAEFRRLPG